MPDRVRDTTVSARALAIGAVLVFAVAFAFYHAFSDYGFQREDEGTLLLQFWRFASGEVPYRDFHVGYTPGVFFLHKTLMQWFGPGPMAGRHLLALAHSATASLLFVLTARMTASWKWALLPPLLYVSAVPVMPGDYAAFNIPYPGWYNLLLFAVTAAFLPRLAESPTGLRVLAAGALAGLGFTFKPNVGLFQLAASALTLLGAVRVPSHRVGRGLWWAWWAAIVAGLLAVFSSVPSAGELAALLAPAILAAIVVARDANAAIARDANAAIPQDARASIAGGAQAAIARDAFAATPRERAPSLVHAALAMAAGFLLVCLPWMAWALSIVGPQWFARRALLVSPGLESVYYLSGPSLKYALVLLGAGVLAWKLPSWIEGRGWPAWPLPPFAVAVAALLFAAMAATRPMPEGLYDAVMKQVEPNLFAAALFVQLAVLLLVLARPAGAADRRARAVATTSVCGTMLYLQIYPRTDLVHWVACAPLLFPGAAWLLQEMTRRWSAGGGPRQHRIVAAALALPFVAVASLRVGHFLDARWDLVDGVPRRTPETTLRIAHAPLSINAGEADRYRDLEATVDFVHANAQPGDAVLTFPALDYVSYFSLTTPGNRHGYYFPGWPGHDVEAEVLAAYAHKPPRLVVALHEPQLYFWNAAAYYFLLGDFIDSRYERVAQRGPYAILAPKSAIAPDAGDDLGASVADIGAVAGALGQARVDALRAELASTDASQRLRAVQGMEPWRIGADFEPLRAALGDADAAVRSAAVRAVAPTRSPAMRDALLQGVAARAFAPVDSVLALRKAGGACDASCVPTLLAIGDAAGGDGAFDPEVVTAARGLMASLPTRRWQFDFWWKKDEAAPQTLPQPFPEPALSRLRAALENPADDRDIRNLAFAYADRLGLGPCPEVLRRWSDMRVEQVGPDFTVCTAINHLSRASCEGPWLDAALRWFPLDPTLSPRVALREAPRDPVHADAALAAIASSQPGSVRATALWICGLTGSQRCLEAARSVMDGPATEEERVAAAWAWSQLATDDAALAALKERAAADSSPQVAETAAFGIELRGSRAAAHPR